MYFEAATDTTLGCRRASNDEFGRAVRPTHPRALVATVAIGLALGAGSSLAEAQSPAPPYLYVWSGSADTTKRVGAIPSASTVPK